MCAGCGRPASRLLTRLTDPAHLRAPRLGPRKERVERQLASRDRQAISARPRRFASRVALPARSVGGALRPRPIAGRICAQHRLRPRARGGLQRRPDWRVAHLRSPINLAFGSGSVVTRRKVLLGHCPQIDRHKINSVSQKRPDSSFEPHPHATLGAYVPQSLDVAVVYFLPSDLHLWFQCHTSAKELAASPLHARCEHTPQGRPCHGIS